MNLLIRTIGAIAIVAALSIFLTRESKAQNTPNGLFAGTGTVTVTVTDPDGKPISGIKVSLTQPNTTPGAIGPKGGGPDATFRPEPTPLMPSKGDKVIKTGTTDGSGKVTFAGVPEGHYSVVAEGTNLYAKGGADVEKGKTVSLDLKLAKVK